MLSEVELVLYGVSENFAMLYCNVIETFWYEPRGLLSYRLVYSHVIAILFSISG